MLRHRQYDIHLDSLHFDDQVHKEQCRSRYGKFLMEIQKIKFDIKMYSSTSVVFCAELLKLIITFFMFYKECDYDNRKFSDQINRYYLNAPRELAKMSVPSFAYALQNNLDFVGLSNLDAGVYQVSVSR